MTPEPDEGGTAGTVSWRAVYDEARARLAGRVDSPDVEARRIVEEAGGFEGAGFAAGLDELVTQRGMARFDAMLERRLAGEPLQYVLGRWAFRRLDLAVDRRVLIPRPETEEVAGAAMAELDRLDGSIVVDLGTGSGAIALAVADERPGTEVWAVDRSPDAVAVARANLAGLGRAATRVTLLEGSWFDPLPASLLGAVDVVVSNPPYIAAGEDLPAVVADWEPRDALVAGPAGTEAIGAILADVGQWLAPRAAVVIELAPHQAEWAQGQAVALGFEAEVLVDLSGRARTLVARR